MSHENPNNGTSESPSKTPMTKREFKRQKRLISFRKKIGLLVLGSCLAVGIGNEALEEKEPEREVVKKVIPPIEIPPTTPYEMSAEDKKKNDEVNAKVLTYKGTKGCSDVVKVGPNEMCAEQVTPEVDRNSPLVQLKLPGKDKSGNDQRPLMRKQAAEPHWKIAKDCRKKFKIMLVAASAYRFNFVQDNFYTQLPGLASRAGFGRHAIDAVDYWRISANEEQPNPMTVDTEGKVIFLEDLDTDEGKRRFGEVVVIINAEEIAQHPERKERIIKTWIESAKEDFKNNVWGAQDACMESFQQFGFSISHCGVVSNPVNPDALRESWHAEPAKGYVVGCKRWDKTYNANLLMYRKHPPIPDNQYFKRLDFAYKNAIDWGKEKANNIYDWAKKKWDQNK